MDKQKQIEEMTELMANWALRNNMCWHEGHAKALAETFVENDYGKISENAAVLTDKRDIQQFEWSKLVDKMGIFKLIEKECASTRKETAEKFAERLKTECFDGGIDDKWVAVSFSRLNEIAKELTGDKV